MKAAAAAVHTVLLGRELVLMVVEALGSIVMELRGQQTEAAVEALVVETIKPLPSTTAAQVVQE